MAKTTRTTPMRIKKRVLGAPAAASAPSAFPVIEAKPKEPLPAPRFTGMYDGAPAGSVRRIGLVAMSCRDETGSSQPDDKYTAGDYVALLRTPYDPKDTTQVRYRNRIRNRATAITACCVDCVGSRKNVTECAAIECPLWAFRLGSNPFRRRK